MRPMRLPRPKSLSGLMLIGFTIVAAPLLFAIVNAAVQMNRLSVRSQQLVVHGMQGTRNNQRMFEEIEALDRQARLYQVTGSADLLDAYAQHHSRLITAVHELLTLPLDEASQDGVRAVESKANQVLQDLRHAAPNSSRMAEVIAAFPELLEAASGLSDRISLQIDKETASLELATQRAQQNLVWQTLLLVPMTLGVVGIFTCLFGDGARAIA